MNLSDRKKCVFNKWQVKFLIQKTLSMIPCGAVINCHFQKRFGGLSSIDIGPIIKEIKQLYIQPIFRKYKSISNLKIVEIGTGWIPVMPTVLYLLGNECRSFDVAKYVNTAQCRYVMEEIMRRADSFEDIPGGCQLNMIQQNYRRIRERAFWLDVLCSGKFNSIAIG